VNLRLASINPVNGIAVIAPPDQILGISSAKIQRVYRHGVYTHTKCMSLDTYSFDL